MTEPENKGPEKPGDIPGSAPPEDDGVDVSLIRWMLSLTPKQRLQVLQQSVNSIIKLRNAKRSS